MSGHSIRPIPGSGSEQCFFSKHGTNLYHPIVAKAFYMDGLEFKARYRMADDMLQDHLLYFGLSPVCPILFPSPTGDYIHELSTRGK